MSNGSIVRAGDEETDGEANGSELEENEAEWKLAAELGRKRELLEVKDVNTHPVHCPHYPLVRVRALTSSPLICLCFMFLLRLRLVFAIAIAIRLTMYSYTSTVVAL